MNHNHKCCFTCHSLSLTLVYSLFLFLLCFSHTKCQENQPDDNSNNNNLTCVMHSICESRFLNVTRKSPCYQLHSPTTDIPDDDFYNLLFDNCPHLFDNDTGE